MPTRIGCLGGGQLGRMLALAGYPLGLEFTFLEPDPTSSAGQIGHQLVGSYSDPELLRQLGAISDLVTFEFESVPDESAQLLIAQAPVFPPPGALRVGQDRLLEKRLFDQLGIAAAEYAAVDGRGDLEGAWEIIGSPARLKTRRLGYDGHGQARVTSMEGLWRAWIEVGEVPSLLERELAFDRELSILGVRSRSGSTAFYPVTENHHRESVLRFSVAPAPAAELALQEKAEQICGQILDSLEYCGVLAVELFQCGSSLIANEIAPRVHNSGHWTQDGAVTSQFENHLRAGLGWPLGATAASGFSAMINLLTAAPVPALVLGTPGAHLHLYGKAPRSLRKVGHVNIGGDDPRQVTSSIRRVAGLVGVDLPSSCHEESFWPL